jgi:hypothetical protein
MCGISAVFELQGGNDSSHGACERRATLAAKLDRRFWNRKFFTKQMTHTDKVHQQAAYKHNGTAGLMRKAYGYLPMHV